MPLYDYRCLTCGYEEEVLQSSSDEHLTDCPKCKAADFKRQVAAPSFAFKGGGWYKDLYGSATSSSSTSSSSTSESTSSSSSSDSKTTSSASA